jgi:uncharacterized membrane protein
MQSLWSAFGASGNVRRLQQRLARVAKVATLVALSWLFVSTGVMHFRSPAPFVRIVPPYFQHAALLVSTSGALEIVGGLALLWRPLRRAAASGLILLLLAVFPCNINMALHPESFRDAGSPLFFLLRLPVQFFYIALISWCGNVVPATRARSSS